MNTETGASGEDTATMVHMYGDLVGALAMIADSMLSPLVRIGRVEDGHDVLVPFVEFQLTASDLSGSEGNDDDEEDVERYAAILPFENAAFLLADLSGEFDRACKQLSHFMAGPLLIEPSRLLQSVQHTRQALTSLNAALERLERMVKAAPAP